MRGDALESVELCAQHPLASLVPARVGGLEVASRCWFELGDGALRKLLYSLIQRLAAFPANCSKLLLQLLHSVGICSRVDCNYYRTQL